MILIEVLNFFFFPSATLDIGGIKWTKAYSTCEKSGPQGPIGSKQLD